MKEKKPEEEFDDDKDIEDFDDDEDAEEQPVKGDGDY